MPLLSDSPGSPPTGVLADKHVPFTAFLRANPILGKRQETYESLKRESAILETLLENVCGGATYTISFDFAKPIAFTPQFGDKPYRFTVTGHACKRTTFDKNVVGTRWVDADNRGIQGPAAANKSNETPSSDVNDVAKELVMILETTTGLQVYKLTVAGYIFGEKGAHIPL
jgi:hypothetical protein